MLAGLGWLLWRTLIGGVWPLRSKSRADLEQVERTAEQVSQLLMSTMEMRASLGRSIQSVGIVRYGAGEVGGGQSFSVAMADGQGNGVVLSFINGRHTTRVYAKPVHLWGSSHRLSDEEQRAIDQARGTAA